VTVAFGAPLPATTPTAEVRIALMTIGAEAAALRRGPRDVLGREFIKAAKRRFGSFCMADAGTPPMSFGRALTAALLLSQWMRRALPSQPRIGVLLPSSVGGALANLATALAGRTSVNLNFTAGREAMQAAPPSFRKIDATHPRDGPRTGQP